jgi:hypothetical protein
MLEYGDVRIEMRKGHYGSVVEVYGCKRDTTIGLRLLESFL